MSILNHHMKVIFLGTGTSQGIPVIGSDHPVCLSSDTRDKRLRSSVLIEWDSYTYIIDCGPDFRQQMISNNVTKIDGILFTHDHADHIMGLDDIRPFFFKQGDIPIYAHKFVLQKLNERFDYIFTKENKYPGAPSVIENEVKNTSFSLSGIDVLPIEAVHYNLKVFGYRFSNFAYLTDVKTIDQKEIDKLKGVKVLVINALRIEEHHSHFNLEEALNFINEVKPDKAYLTHVSHMLGFHAEVEKLLPANVYLAYDNLQIEI